MLALVPKIGWRKHINFAPSRDPALMDSQILTHTIATDVNPAILLQEQSRLGLGQHDR